MSFAQILNIWPHSPALSLIIALLVAVSLLYLARIPMRKAIFSISRVTHNGFRMMARSVLIAETKVVERNKEVLLNAGERAAEQLIEREFHRVDAAVRRDMSGYPALQRTLAEQIAHIDEDYRESTELPVPPPDWVKAVETLAKLPSKGDKWVANILGEIHKTAIAQHHNAMEEYRNACSKRHSLLDKMMPYWRKLSQTLDQVDKRIIGLHERTKVVDSRMTEYEEIQRKTDMAAHMLTSSSITQFFISAFVLLVAIGGAVINFNLIALPMSEMVGGGSYIGNFKTSNIAALVIILVELAMGLYLMESLRITHLFPIIGQMDDKMRTRMIWATFIILLILAGVESALAFMRDRIAADMQALRQALSTVETAQPTTSWIPTVGQMVLGFILPFALTFVAIPLESFVHSSRTLVGVAMAAFLRSIAFSLRLLGNIAYYLGEFLVNIYDLLIFPALWLENLIRNKEHQTEIKDMTDINDIIVKEEVSQ
jgi:hypothetical protein